MQKKYFLIILFIAFALVSVFFSGLAHNEFIFMGDEYISLSKTVSLNSFFIQQPEDFGTAYSTIIIVTFFDRLFYLLGYILHLSITQIQMIMYFVKITIILVFSFLGFQKLSLFLNKKNDSLITFLISIWYSFSPLALVFWHGTAFSFTALIALALAPLNFYYFLQSISPGSKLKYKIGFTVTLFFVSFTVYFLAVYLIILFLYCCLYVLFKRKNFFALLKNLFILAILYIPFLSINFFFLFDMFFNPITSVNMTTGETYGNLKGSFLYPLFMWFSWGIYTIWQPRNMYTFYKYFYSIPYLITPFLLYGLIIQNLRRNISKPFFISLIIIIFLLLFIIKGPQPPFGQIYLFLIDHFSLFKVFRSPDNKLGFGIVFLLSVLLIYNSQNIRRKIFIYILSLVLIIQTYLMYTGIAIKGQQTPFSTDRILHITEDYQKLINTINSTDQYGYILPLPGLEYTQYRLGENEVHLGQDLLSKVLKLPLAYVSPYGGITVQTYKKISQSIRTNNIEALQDTPILYVLVRNDILRVKPKYAFIHSVKETWKLEYSSDLFALYKNTKPLPIIYSENTSFKVISPIEFHISIKNIKDPQELFFFQSFNKNWELFPRKVYSKNTFVKNYLLIKEKPLFSDQHTITKGYANSWLLSDATIKQQLSSNSYSTNKDGSINIDLILFYRPQIYFNFAVFISGVYVLLLGTFYILIRRKNDTS